MGRSQKTKRVGVMELFEPYGGAEFSNDRMHRYTLWRIWDKSKPLVMFIGLNPSTANETDPDPTIESVIRIARFNGYGGVYMLNCFTYISTEPKDLKDFSNTWHNDRKLREVSNECKDVVFAWGAFSIVSKLGRDAEIKNMFPNALCIDVLKGGQPRHPLYCKEKTKLIQYPQQKLINQNL